MFSDQQKSQLEGKLAPERVRQRKGADGKPVLYVEAWDLVEQANHIFGFGNWSRETVSVEAIHAPVMRVDERDERRNVMVASFWAKVRISVLSPDGTRSIVREGCGAATAYQKTVGDAVEQAIKAAESDATKRAFATFGNQFGLALYDKSHKNVGHDDPPPADGGRRAAIDVGFDGVNAESGRESGAPRMGRTPESAPSRPTNSERALATLDTPPRPAGNGHYGGRGPQTNGSGLRY
jgi:DNA repair and recombination protein RAD52